MGTPLLRREATSCSEPPSLAPMVEGPPRAPSEGRRRSGGGGDSSPQAPATPSSFSLQKRRDLRKYSSSAGLELSETS